MRGAAMTMAATMGAVALVAGCSLPFGGIPASERALEGDRDAPGVVRSDERGFLTGLFGLTPADLPDAVPVPMREATLERGFGGVIIRATGVGPTQGWFNAALLAANDGAPDAAGVLTVSLVAVPPQQPEAVGPERTRLLLTGAFIQDLELRGVRAIRVVSAQTSVTLPVPPRPAPPPIPDEIEL